MQLHDDALNHTEAILIVKKLQDELADGSNLTIWMLQAVLKHLLHFVEWILWPLSTGCHVIYSLIDYRVEVKCSAMDQTQAEKNLLG